MRNIEGFICIGWQKEPIVQAHLFGKNTGNGQGFIESLNTNGLTPLQSIYDAMNAYFDLLGKQRVIGYHRLEVAFFELQIPQNSQEIRHLREQTAQRWITLKFVPDCGEIVFYGKHDSHGLQDGHIGTLLETNGLKPFTNFTSAYQTALEINRQAQSAAQIAAFALRKIRLGNKH